MSLQPTPTSIGIAPHLEVSTSPPPTSLSTNAQLAAGLMEDNGRSGSAPKTGMLVVCRGTPPVGTGPYHKGGELLEPPNFTTPQRYKAWSPPGGGIELEGARKSTIL